MEKVKTGIFGLNPLLDGGFNKNSVTVVVGAPGAGKTTFVNQFLRKGLEEGQEAIYISLEENKEQIVAECKEMGWDDVDEYFELGLLVLLEAGGIEFSKFIKDDFPSFVNEWKGSEARIVIDPLTPIIWAEDNKYEQRSLISSLFKEAKKIGTVVATLEEHGVQGYMGGEEVITPMYLADCVIHLKIVEPFGRMLSIRKCRSSWHSEEEHPFKIIRGPGLIVHRKPIFKSIKTIPADLKARIEGMLSAVSEKDRRHIESVLEHISEEDMGEIEPKELVDYIMEEYGVKSAKLHEQLNQALEERKKDSEQR